MGENILHLIEDPEIDDLSCSNTQHSSDYLKETRELYLSPNIDPYFENTPPTSTSFRDSPPIGRTAAAAAVTLSKELPPTYNFHHRECNLSSPVETTTAYTDSGFSSWTSCSVDSRTKTSISSYDSLSHSTFSHGNKPYQTSNSNETVSQPTTSTNLISVPLEAFNNKGPSLSNLPCANALNEELSDTMFVGSMGDMNLKTDMVNASDSRIHWPDNWKYQTLCTSNCNPVTDQSTSSDMQLFHSIELAPSSDEQVSRSDQINLDTTQLSQISPQSIGLPLNFNVQRHGNAEQVCRPTLSHRKSRLSLCNSFTQIPTDSCVWQSPSNSHTVNRFRMAPTKSHYYSNQHHPPHRCQQPQPRLQHRPGSAPVQLAEPEQFIHSNHYLPNTPMCSTISGGMNHHTQCTSALPISISSSFRQFHHHHQHQYYPFPPPPYNHHLHLNQHQQQQQQASCHHHSLPKQQQHQLHHNQHYTHQLIESSSTPLSTPSQFSPLASPQPITMETMPDVVPRMHSQLRSSQYNSLCPQSTIWRNYHNPQPSNLMDYPSRPTSRCASVPLSLTDRNFHYHNVCIPITADELTQSHLPRSRLVTSGGSGSITGNNHSNNAHMNSARSRQENMYLLVSRMRDIGDELALNYSRQSLPSENYLRHGMRRATRAAQSVLRFSSSLVSLVASPRDCFQRIIELASQSISGNSSTPTTTTNHSPLVAIQPRRRRDTFNTIRDYLPRRSLQFVTHESDRLMSATTSAVLPSSGNHQFNHNTDIPINDNYNHTSSPIQVPNRRSAPMPIIVQRMSGDCIGSSFHPIMNDNASVFTPLNQNYTTFDFTDELRVQNNNNNNNNNRLNNENIFHFDSN